MTFEPLFIRSVKPSLKTKDEYKSLTLNIKALLIMCENNLLLHIL